LNYGALQIEVESHINTILVGKLMNLKTINIIGGSFNKFNKTQSASNRGQQITALCFRNTSIDKEFLPLLSSDFPKLERFDHCALVNDFGSSINIDMSETAIDMLNIWISGEIDNSSSIVLHSNLSRR
jgi:hypothetical protein